MSSLPQKPLLHGAPHLQDHTRINNRVNNLWSASHVENNCVSISVLSVHLTLVSTKVLNVESFRCMLHSGEIFIDIVEYFKNSS